MSEMSAENDINKNIEFLLLATKIYNNERLVKNFSNLTQVGQKEKELLIKKGIIEEDDLLWKIFYFLLY